jgi:ribosomal protein L30
MNIARLLPLTQQFIPNIFKVTLIKSSTKANPKVRSNLEALGMTKINKHRYHKNTPEIRGMIYVVLPSF